MIPAMSAFEKPHRDEPVERAVRRILAQLPGLPAGRPVVTALQGGITNRNYRVEVGGQTLVLRIGSEHANLLGIDRRREHAASLAAAQVGVGAEVVGFVEEEGALVTRFIAGAAISPDAAREPGMLRRIVESLRSCHEGPAIPGVFSPFETVRSYSRLTVQHGGWFPPQAEEALRRLEEIEAALGKPPRLVPCHNDLLASNFIDDGSRVRILDWEYAAMGDPFFDLGNLAANQELPGDQCEALLADYRGACRPEDLARLHLQRLASDMREAYWGFLQMGISTLEFDYREYAVKHLERFLSRAREPQFADWLAGAAGSRREEET